jgi:hypothetical protein
MEERNKPSEIAKSFFNIRAPIERINLSISHKNFI